MDSFLRKFPLRSNETLIESSKKEAHLKNISEQYFQGPFLSGYKNSSNSRANETAIAFYQFKDLKKNGWGLEIAFHYLILREYFEGKRAGRWLKVESNGSGTRPNSYKITEGMTKKDCKFCFKYWDMNR